jgi:hypothetical protein
MRSVARQRSLQPHNVIHCSPASLYLLCSLHLLSTRVSTTHTSTNTSIHNPHFKKSIHESPILIRLS